MKFTMCGITYVPSVHRSDTPRKERERWYISEYMMKIEYEGKYWESKTTKKGVILRHPIPVSILSEENINLYVEGIKKCPDKSVSAGISPST